MSTQHGTLDQAEVNDFLGQAIQDVAATFHAGLVLIGDRLGLYRAMAGAGGLTPTELAKRTGTHRRYVAEWLSAQAAGGYVTYDAPTGRFTLPPEQAFVLLDADLPGAFGWARLGHDESDRGRLAPGPESVGTSTTQGLQGASASSGPRMPCTLHQPVDPGAEGVRRSSSREGVADVDAGTRVHHHHGAAFPRSTFRGLTSMPSPSVARRAREGRRLIA
jgi:hypothetical protein